MKLINLIILIALFLSACGANTQFPMPTVTTSPTPEASPTASLTPTPEGPREGQTRFKEGVGDQVYQVIRDKEGNIMFAEWVRVKTPGDGIPMFDFTSKDYYGYRTLGHVQLFCSDRLEGCIDVPKFTHVDKLSENLNDSDLSASMKVIMYKRLHNGKIPSGKEMNDFLVSHANGVDFNFFLTDPEHPLTWHLRPGPDPSVKVILTDWDDPMLQGSDGLKYGSMEYRHKILGVDNEGRLVGIMATKEPVHIEDTYAWAWLILLHPSLVFQDENVLNIESHSVLNDMVIASMRESFQGNPWIISESDK